MHLVGFITRIYHDARPPERQTYIPFVFPYQAQYDVSFVPCLHISVRDTTAHT